MNTIEGSDLLLETRQGHVRVLSSGDTLLRIPGVENPTLDDLNTGDVVVCGGSWEDHATFRALAVLVRVGSQWRGLSSTILGRPTAVGTNHLAASTTHGLSSYQAAIWSDCEQVLS